MDKPLLTNKMSTHVKKIGVGVLLILGFSSLRAQTLTDGLMMPKNNFCTGFMYTHDSWTEYWEGELKRENGNIGRVTTQGLMWFGNYGITDKINVIAMVPYMKTEASQGTLTGMEGLQDLSVGVKYNFFTKDFEKSVFKTFAALNFSTPLSDYTPDFLPLAIGSHTTNIAYRLNAFYKMEPGFFVNAAAGYTWRSNTTLDRPSYYDGDDFYNSDEVEMPNVFDYIVSLGYLANGLQVELNYVQQNTLGGGDIRRQDMPFVSNRMNFQKVGLLAMYYLPKPKGFAIRGSVQYTVAGRNVGQSTTFLGGIMYTFHFGKEQE